MRRKGMKKLALILSGAMIINAASVTELVTATEVREQVVTIESTEEVESEWLVDLKYAKAIDDDGNQIVFNNAVVTIPEGEGVYSISTTISGGTMSTTIPTLEDGTVVKASMNLAKTECVYTFTKDGEPSKISKEVAEEIIRNIEFLRSTGQDMAISATVDGSYTLLPDGIAITAGQDEDGLGGHFYGYVASTGITWVNAYNAARKLYYKGMQGYLVTIARAEEDTVLDNITLLAAWSGGTRAVYSAESGDNNRIKNTDELILSTISTPVAYDEYYWSAGPEGEVGETYSKGTYSQGNLYQGKYINWNGIQPDYAGSAEGYMQTHWTGGTWNDLPNSYSSIAGYFVEFGDVAVPEEGESDFYDGENGSNFGSSASSQVEVPNVRLNFTDDMIYDGESLEEPELSGGDESMTITYYKEDGTSIEYSEIIDAGVYYAEIYTGLTIVTQYFEVFPKPVTVSYDGGPYIYNSKEQVPAIFVNADDLVIRSGNAEKDICEVTAQEVQLLQIARAITSDDARDAISAGEHQVIATEVSNSNYEVSNLSESYDYEITRKPIYATYTDTTADYTGQTLAPTINLVGVESSVSGTVDNAYGTASPAVTDPGNYTIAALLDGTHSNNYELTSGLTCTFTINKMSVAFEVPSEVVEPGTTPDFAPTKDNTDTEELNDRVSVDIEYEVYYMDSEGNIYEGPEVPEEPGIFDVYISIVEENFYRHEGLTNAEATKVGSIVVDVEDGEVSANATYGNIVFDDGNEESSVADVIDALDGTVTVLPTPEKEGYIFLGWELDGRVYKAGERVEVQGDVTMIAMWSSTEGEPTAGQVVGADEESGLVGATVTVWDGDTVIAQVVTDENGNYDFGYPLPDGIYNITIEKEGTTVTTKVEVEDGQMDEPVQVYPEDGKSSIVQILPGTTGVVVGNVDKLADELEGEGSFMVTVDDEISDEFKEALEDILLSDGIIVDLEIIKDGTVQDEIGALLEVVVKLPGAAQNHEEYWVYIYDEETGEVTEISTTPNVDGEYFEIAEDGKTITIYTNKTNTFVVDYFTPDRYEVILPETSGGSVTTDIEKPKDGDTVTIYPEPEEGYEVGKVVVKDEEGNVLEVVDNGDGTYSFVQPPIGQVTIEVEFTEVEEAGGVQKPNVDPNLDGDIDTDDGAASDATIDGADTSDNTNVALYLMLAIMSLAVILFQRKRVIR